MRHMSLPKYLRSTLAALMLSVLGAMNAAHADPAQYPLFLQQLIKPNVMFTLDNSGSMAWGSLTGADATDEYNGTQTRKAYHSSGYNQIYYNPAITYTPALNYDSTSMGNASITAARIDAFPTTGGSTATVNLTTTCYAASTPTLPLYDPSNFAANTTNCKTSSGTSGYANLVSRYAFYYAKRAGLTSPDGSSGQDTTTNYVRKEIISTTTSYAKASTRTDCAGTTCTYAEEIQNFANWFSYYRTRIMMAKASMGAAFAGIDVVQTPAVEPKFRVGFNTINGISGTSVTYNNGAVTDGAGWLTIKNFNSAQKQLFFTKLYAISPNQGTPLRTQMDRVGKLYSKTLSGFDYTNNDPFYLDNPTDKTLVSCRPSFHILTSDGYWNDTYTGTDVGNQDGSCSTGDTCFSTRAIGAYDANASSKSLADIALYYYKTDIRTDLANKVPFSDQDPQGLTDEQKGRQRMVTYTVGLGANGTLAYPTDLAAVKAGTKDWPAPTADSASAVDDMWHAAVNGRGEYYKASNSAQLRDNLITALNNITQVSRSAATETASSPVVATGTIQFEPSFKSVTWTGSLTAYSLTVSGSTESWTKKWNAADLLPAAASRNIVTNNGTAPVDFLWANLSTSQQTALGSANVLNYLRGDASLEKANGGSYRDRVASKLGDIVDSAPLYVKKGTDQGYSTLPTIGTSYAAFRDSGAKSTRSPMLYVGANDGMFHAFDATVDLTNSGKELFAYVPMAVYGNLKSLSETTYEHKYFVDGQMTEGDAYIGSPTASWKTVLLGTAGAGAKSVFAVDITNPSSLTKDSVMWEINGTSDTNLGYVLGEARVALLNNGVWVAILGNGYSSTNGTAKLLLKNLSNGSDYLAAATNATTSNGLSTPALVYDKLNRVITAYAGDLQGNLWKFDFSSNPAAPTVSKLFTAASGQPIIQKPVYKQHPQGGYMVLFGTGKYFDSTDGSASDTTTQSLYGIWDKPSASGNLTRTDLQQQTLTAATGGASVSSNSVNWSSQRGWYLDMTLNAGERAIANPVLIDDIFVTKSLDPAGTLCSEGGDSYLYGVSYLSGGSNTPPSFGTLNVKKMSGGGTAGLQVVQQNGQVYVRTQPLSGVGSPSEKTPVYSNVPGFRTWRQVPISY